MPPLVEENTPSLHTPIVRLPPKVVVPGPLIELRETVPTGLFKNS
jgi:hypothetical protein